MKKLSAKGMAQAFSLIELLVLLLVLVVLSLCLIPGLVPARRQSKLGCVNNLKQVGLAFRTWCIDSSGDYPMQAPTAVGGTKELIGSGQVFIHFLVMSNELSTPKILVCPWDKAKMGAATFSSGLSDTNVSYFVGTDSKETEPRMLLSGDRHLASQGQPIKPGLFLLTTNNTSISWTKAMHRFCGNVALADGSVQSYRSKELREAVPRQGVATNLLAIP